MDAPLDTMPIFVKDGAIIFKKEGMQHVFDKEEAPVIVEIWKADDSTNVESTAILYEDEGEGYGYENGEYSQIDFNLVEGRLVIGKIDGSFKGMMDERTFIIKCNGKEKEVSYNGEELIISL